MLENETMQSILKRRSHKSFKSDPIDDDILTTILEAGQYAPTGMNRQPWHFTVIQSEKGKRAFAEAVESMRQKTPNRPGGTPPPQPPNVVVLPDAEFRGAPVLIVVSGDAAVPTAQADCILATQNMYIAAASFGVMSGWSHMTVLDVFSDPAVKDQFQIPTGYDVYSASFFGYPLGETKDRGPRKEGTVTFI